MITHRTLQLPDLRMRIAEAGAGPLVVLCHGFPGLSHVFRHQLVALADAGYHAVAPDMRGYGGTDAPLPVEAYAQEEVVSDLANLLDALGVARAVFVGHDFGAQTVWSMALRKPERVRGVVSLSVPYEPRRSPWRPSASFARLAEKHFFHVHYFQAAGVAEAELDPRAREFIARVYHALSGDFTYADIWKQPARAGAGYLDVLPPAPDVRPSWFPEEDLDVVARAFEQTGFRGGLSWYRAFDVNWERSAAFEGAKILVPALYVAGARDVVVQMAGDDGLARMAEHVPDLRGTVLLPGAGHWVQLERAREVDAELLRFLAGLPDQSR